MECPFHAGNEAITTCVQCETPICPLCASETNQIQLCLNCYHARVEEISSRLGASTTRMAAGRQKAEAKAGKKERKKKAAEAPVPAATAETSQQMGAGAVMGMAAPPAMEEAPPSKKELARMKKEEAKRLKMEKKAAKAKPEAAPPAPEPAPFFEPKLEPPQMPPQQAAPSAPPTGTPFDFTPEPSGEGVKLPKLEGRLEPMPFDKDDVEKPPRPEMEPPEGFFD
jgi:hypothetical protein